MVALAPVSADTLAALVAGQGVAGPVLAYAATPLLLETFGLSAADDEEAERTALQLAGLAALIDTGRRLVVVSPEPYAADPEGSLGECTVPALSGLTAVFADGDDAAEAVAAARAAAAGMTVDAAWELPEVQRLLAEHELLWFGPEEAGTLLGG